MKIIHKSLLATALALAGLTFNSCEDGDKVVDDIFDNTTSGIVLRTVNVESDELPIGQSDSYFGVELEMQDEEDGALVESLEVYVSFNDNTVEEGETDLSAAEVMVTSIPSSEFTIGEYGFPRYSYSITLPEMATALGIDESTDVDGGDTFYVRFEAVLVDGRRFSNGDNTDTSTGSFFASPFLYISTVVCPEVPPVAGDWTIEMQDSWGDGWNGATIVVDIDGTETVYTLEDGASQTTTVTIPDGTESLSFSFTSGDWDSEISFQIYSSAGNLKADIAPAPAVGEVVLNYCVD
ncbi:hypothetical protein [Flagellimonas okinawensis]|uniref:DUF1735 domain-containing protein n=1 Tax=Flagellimonas okinawensis TaxID=3031324 RepID=A0ABT5XSU1_9FLAO|nr:hypothetical protein [[Muricauda] okinawensis]MDF0708959.1 hypothetical protein [[Muricauda] okinawensis]